MASDHVNVVAGGVGTGSYGERGLLIFWLTSIRAQHNPTEKWCSSEGGWVCLIHNCVSWANKASASLSEF